MSSTTQLRTSPGKATLFQNATIISYDKSTKSLKILRNASMLVENDRIKGLSENGESISAVPADAEVVDATNKIISPGFIDTHHHLWQTGFRTLAGNVTLLEYFDRYGPTGAPKDHITVNDMYLGQIAGLIELIECGTTTVLDHALGIFSEAHVDAALKATFESAVRVFFAHTVEAIGDTGLPFEQAVAKFKAMRTDKRFTDPSNPVELGLSYDKWFLQDPAQSAKTQQVADLLLNSDDNQKPISVVTTHMVGGPYGAGNTPSLLSSVLRSSQTSEATSKPPLPVVISHASFLSNTDAMMLRDPYGQHPHLKMTISTTPESEMHYGHTSTGADATQSYASLGVDTHFTFSSYMPVQARLWMQSLRLQHYTQTAVANREMPVNNPMAVNDAFLLATQKGGEALGRDDLGVIIEGACADIVVFNTEAAGLWGWKDPVAAVVLHSGPGDVEGVMVAGRWVKRDSKIVSPLVGLRESDASPVEVGDVKKRFEESAKRIQKTWAELGPFSVEAGGDWGGGVAKFGRCREVHVQQH